MIDNKRRDIAAIAYVLISRRMINGIFDYPNYMHTNLLIQVNGKSISVFDYSRNNYIGGYLPNLFDYSTASYIILNIIGNSFNGFDYQSSSYFNGSVNSNYVQIFDYQKEIYYHYSV